MRDPTNTTTLTTPDVDHPEARSKQATLGHMDHVLTGNRQRTMVDALASKAAVWAKRLVGEVMQMQQHGFDDAATVACDKAYQPVD